MDLIEFLGIKAIYVTKEEVCLELSVQEQHKQPYGVMHGGISGVLAETAASMGANAHLDTTKEVAVGLELNVNHLRGVTSGTIRAYATPLHIGNNTQVWEIKIKNQKQQLISAGRCTLFVQQLRR